jgi:uncharacterized protein (UPF0305 family)
LSWPPCNLSPSAINGSGMSDDETHQLEFVSQLIDALMTQLEQTKDRPATREEIAKKIVRLGALYRAIRTGDDLFVQAR